MNKKIVYETRTAEEQDYSPGAAVILLQDS